MGKLLQERYANFSKFAWILDLDKAALIEVAGDYVASGLIDSVDTIGQYYKSFGKAYSHEIIKADGKFTVEFEDVLRDRIPIDSRLFGEFLTQLSEECQSYFLANTDEFTWGKVIVGVANRSVSILIN